MSLLATRGAVTRLNESFIFSRFSFSIILSASEISHVFVFLRVRSENEVNREHSLVCDSLSFRCAHVVDKARGKILLRGVVLSLADVPIVNLAFATHAFGLAEGDVLSAFADPLTVVEVVVGGDIRRTLPGVVAGLGFAKLVLVAATNNTGVTEVATVVTRFPPWSLRQWLRARCAGSRRLRCSAPVNFALGRRELAMGNSRIES